VRRLPFFIGRLIQVYVSHIREKSYTIETFLEEKILTLGLE